MPVSGETVKKSRVRSLRTRGARIVTSDEKLQQLLEAENNPVVVHEVGYG